MVLDIAPRAGPWGPARQVADTHSIQARVVLPPLLATAAMAFLVVRPDKQLHSLSNRIARLAVLGWGLYSHAVLLLCWRFPIPGIIPHRLPTDPAGMGKGFGDTVAQHFGVGFYLAVNACRLVVWALATRPPEPYRAILERRQLQGKPTVPSSQIDEKNKQQLGPSEPSLPMWMDLMINLRLKPRGPRLSLLSDASGQSKWSIRWRHLYPTLICGGILYLITDLIESVMRDDLVFPPATLRLAAPLSSANSGVFGRAGPLLMAVLFVWEFDLNLLTIFVALKIMYLLIHPDPDVHPWQTLPGGNVLTATSVTSLWKEHWHQFLRPVLLDFAARPTSRCVSPLLGRGMGRAVSVISAFLLSGLIHEVGASYMSVFSLIDRAPGAAIQFFLFQAGLVLLEQKLAHTPVGRAWKRLPSQMTAVLGWTWTYIFLPWSGWRMVDAWNVYGCSAANSTPRLLTPVTQPVIRRLSQLPLFSRQL